MRAGSMLWLNRSCHRPKGTALVLPGLLGILGLMGAGCGGSKTNGPSKFDLKQDNQGHLIRLNKETGEAWIVDGGQLIPVREAEAGSNDAQRAPVKPKATRERAPTIQPTTSNVPNVLLSPISEELSIQTVTKGQMVTSTTMAPVFVNAFKSATPLVVASAGSVFRLLGVEGDWYHVEFDDIRWGRRAGFIEKKFGAVSQSGSKQEPVDLSIPDPK